MTNERWPQTVTVCPECERIVEPESRYRPYNCVVHGSVSPVRLAVVPAKRLTFTQDWYSTRWQRLADELRGTDVWPRVACIMANGTAEATEPQTYAQQINVLRARTTFLEGELRNALAREMRLRNNAT